VSEAKSGLVRKTAEEARKAAVATATSETVIGILRAGRVRVEGGWFRRAGGAPDACPGTCRPGAAGRARGREEGGETPSPETIRRAASAVCLTLQSVYIIAESLSRAFRDFDHPSSTWPVP
jgi:hypothetical protein